MGSKQHSYIKSSTSEIISTIFMLQFVFDEFLKAKFLD